ncbi:MAG: DNA polymerase III subunit delta' [Chloroflexi bacterium]|nr:MAG: DNA polymerase III subunit delta' [Chloroflexota bacterium]
MTDEFLGNGYALHMLREHVAQGRVRHAYLFTGPSGLGRRTLALYFAQSVNCTQPLAPGEPCGTCSSCLRFAKMQHPDLSTVQAEQEGGTLKVDQIRELQHSLALAPYEARYRIALLLRFEEANQNAQNALLKTLEEPNRQVLMLLTASSAEDLLPTIVSRCEVVRMSAVPLEELKTGLQTFYKIPAEEAALLAHLSEGRPGLARRYYNERKLLDSRETVLGEHRHLLSSSRAERFAYADKVTKRTKDRDPREELRKILVIWLSYWRDILLTTAGAEAPITNLDHKTEIEALAAALNLQTVHKAAAAIQRTLGLLEINANTKLALEVLLLDLPRLDQVKIKE